MLFQSRFPLDMPLSEGAGGLRILDIVDPVLPVETGLYGGNGLPQDIEVGGNLAAVAAAKSGLLLFDLFQPGAPREVGRLARWDPQNPQTPGATGVALAGDLAWVSYAGNGLQAVDISEPAVPVEAGFLTNGDTGPGRPVLSGNHAFLGGGTKGVLIVDIRDPSGPALAASFGDVFTSGGEVELSGDHLWVAGSFGEFTGLSLLDIGQHTSPVWQATHLQGIELHDIEVGGNLLYLAAGERGLIILEVTDPFEPVTIGEFAQFGPIESVKAHGTNLWLLRGNEVIVVDVRAPASPRRMVWWMEPGQRAVYWDEPAEALAFHGNSVLVARGGGVRVLSVRPFVDAGSFSNGEGFRVYFRSLSGQTVRFQRSDDLRTWAPWIEVPATGDLQDLLDPDAAAGGSRFYRAETP